MPKLDDLLKNGTALGIALGVGATVLAAAIIPNLPAVARAARPAARQAVKTGILWLEKGREWVAEASEEFEDIVAEARAELRQAYHERAPRAGASSVVNDPPVDATDHPA